MDERPGAILAMDTATGEVVIGIASPDGARLGLSRWPAGHRHGEQLLPAIERLLSETGLQRSQLTGIVVGTGPGAFTGLRVGLATAKALAHALGCRIGGVPTGEALLVAAAVDAGLPLERLVLLMPAGPSDRVEVRAGRPARRLAGGSEPDLAPDDVLVAVDLAERAPADAVARGERARAGLGEVLLRLGAERLRQGGDPLSELVPEYVTLPRGVAAATGEVAWSHDPR